MLSRANRVGHTVVGSLLSGNNVSQEGGALPFGDAHVFLFTKEATPGLSGGEAIIILDKERAVISCDAFQNMADCKDPAFSFGGALVSKLMGFIHPHSIGPGWLMAMKATDKNAAERFPVVAEFERLLADDTWDNLLPAHGSPSSDSSARDGLRVCMARIWPKWCAAP